MGNHIIGVATGSGMTAKDAAYVIERFAAEIGIKTQTSSFKSITK